MVVQVISMGRKHMLKKTFRGVAWSVPFFLLSGYALMAQAPEQKPAPRKTPPPANGLNLQPSVEQSMATIERMIEAAVRGVASTYNLNDEQRRVTEEIMKRDVQKFLKDHESQVWPLIRELIAMQFNPKPGSDPEKLKKLGKECRPLAKLAQEAIVKGNLEWREKVLTAEQKKRHDYDMEQIEKTFQQIDRNFSDWEEGRVTGKSLFPQPTPGQGPPPPPRPRTEGLPDPVTERVAALDTIFDTFVDQFIKDYGLDEGQVVSARSILREYKDKAADFKNSNKDEIARLTKDMKDARDQRNEEKSLAAEGEYKKLIQPVYDMFGSMETRLVGLLTSVQAEKYNANQRALDPTTKPAERKANAERPKAAEPPAPPAEPAAKPAESAKESKPAPAQPKPKAKPAPESPAPQPAEEPAKEKPAENKP